MDAVAKSNLSGFKQPQTSTQKTETKPDKKRKIAKYEDDPSYNIKKSKTDTQPKEQRISSRDVAKDNGTNDLKLLLEGTSYLEEKKILFYFSTRKSRVIKSITQ